MSATKHTPGPWRKEQRHHVDKYRTEIWSGSTCIVREVNLGGHYFQAEGIANAARIVACVNAMEGVDDPAELMRAVRYAMDYCAQSGNWFPGIKEVKAALAKAEGK